MWGTPWDDDYTPAGIKPVELEAPHCETTRGGAHVKTFSGGPAFKEKVPSEEVFPDGRGRPPLS